MPQFRAKARAVDLLGKGQIADLPTAISELWKNGYDAYGDKLEASLYKAGYQNYPDPVFVVSDNGKGMDDKDVLDKWFVLGTDSKSRATKDEIGPETLDKKPRIKMGEKGIGRLAVSYLGPQMLMLTKKNKHPLEIVFFDWRILDNYELFLSDVNIPIRTISSTEEFRDAFEELREEFLENFPEIKDKAKDPWKDQLKLKKEIIEDCELLFIPEFIIEDCIDDLAQGRPNMHATRFVIFRPDQQIIDLPDFKKTDNTKDTDDISANYTLSTLTGLFNKFKNDEPENKTHLWIYESDSTGKHDLLAAKAFFEPEDFKKSDHLIEGSFDIEGKFSGSVRIYNKTINHTFKPVNSRKETRYGPFNIKFGYIQYYDEVSLLNEETKRVFEEKLKFYSGLFIYRDGFRVLPYGRPDTDFLEFEERRTKSAGENFFSKRRMFGYIEITREYNELLKDKSSREGFINNQAYRDFKVDLIAFFKDLAKKYFGTTAEESYKRDQQEELAKLSKVVKEENKKDIQARKEFALKLKQLPNELKNLQTVYEELIAQLDTKASQTNIIYEEIEDLLNRVEQCKIKINELKIQKPVRYKPTPLQTKNFHAYTKTYNSTVKQFRSSSTLLNSVSGKLKIHEMFKAYQDKAELLKNTLASSFNQFSSQLDIVFNNIKVEFENERLTLVEDFEDKCSAILPSKNNLQEINNSTKLLESIFNDSRDRITERITPYLDHLSRLSFDVNEDDLVGYYKQQFEEIKQEWNQTYELAQLGIAVEIIDHQFNTLYAQLAQNIGTLKKFMVSGKEAENKYKTLNTAFDHLQDNYKLLQPLYRTTGKIRAEITATELKEYIEDFFGDKLVNNNIKVKISDAGKKWKIKSYESIFKPVIINIINNAIYWLQPVQKKEILFDANEDSLLIMNSGQPIEDYMLEDIFKLFFSDRPSGRGIGLYLAKHSLNGIGFEIEATNNTELNKLGGACFRIKPNN